MYGHIPSLLCPPVFLHRNPELLTTCYQRLVLMELNIQVKEFCICSYAVFMNLTGALFSYILQEPQISHTSRFPHVWNDEAVMILPEIVKPQSFAPWPFSMSLASNSSQGRSSGTGNASAVYQDHLVLHILSRSSNLARHVLFKDHRTKKIETPGQHCQSKTCQNIRYWNVENCHIPRLSMRYLKLFK